MKKNFIYLSVSCLLISFLLLSCGIQKERETGNKKSSAISKNTSSIWNNTVDYTYAQKEQFKTDVENAEKKLNDKIDALRKKAGVSWGNVKENYNDGVEKLVEDRRFLNKKMSDFNDVTKENWNDFKSGVNSAWRDIEKTWKITNENS
ncbi:MAG: hypothetical protein P8Z35_21155 [Ignavibacteriaceae bacterium]